MENQYNQGQSGGGSWGSGMENQYNQGQSGGGSWGGGMENQYNQGQSGGGSWGGGMENQYNQDQSGGGSWGSGMENQYNQPGSVFSGVFSGVAIPHMHPVTSQVFEGNLKCDMCGKFGDGSLCYSCRDCDMDLCQTCCSKLLYAPPKNLHHHPLMLTKRDGWACDICKNTGNALSMYCQECDYDCCTDCYCKDYNSNNVCSIF